MIDPRRAPLVDLVGAYAPTDGEERAHRDAVLELLTTCERPFDRAHYAPGHITASAFVCAPGGGELLLIYHGKLHRWLQPGGHVEPEDADIEAAARREVREEVGLTQLVRRGPGLFDVDVHVIPARAKTGEPEHRHFDLRFLFESPHRAAEAGSDAQAARWLPLSQVSLAESDASVMRAVHKLAAQG